ncbi:MAG: phosphoribosylformylglycinamidine synthase subunit PurQ, partial [Candidatus Omnitrophota bacterium]
CDQTGRILGLMPHPERHIYAAQHPRKDQLKKAADGLQIFKNGVDFIKKNRAAKRAPAQYNLARGAC